MTAYRNKYTFETLLPVGKCYSADTGELIFVFRIKNLNEYIAHEAKKFKNDYKKEIYEKIKVDRIETE